MALVKLYKSGSWTRAGFAKAFQEASRQATSQVIADTMNRVSDKAVRTIKWHIMKQDLGWKPLSRESRKRKNSDMAWIWTGTIFNNIEADTRFSGGSIKATKAFQVTIGIKKGLKHPESGTDLGVVVEANEKQRPLFAPSTQEVKEWQKLPQNNPILQYRKLMRDKGFDLEKK